MTYHCPCRLCCIDPSVVTVRTPDECNNIIIGLCEAPESQIMYALCQPKKTSDRRAIHTHLNHTRYCIVTVPVLEHEPVELHCLQMGRDASCLTTRYIA